MGGREVEPFDNVKSNSTFAEEESHLEEMTGGLQIELSEDMKECFDGDEVVSEANINVSTPAGDKVEKIESIDNVKSNSADVEEESQHEGVPEELEIELAENVKEIFDAIQVKSQPNVEVATKAVDEGGEVEPFDNVESNSTFVEEESQLEEMAEELQVELSE